MRRLHHLTAAVLLALLATSTLTGCGGSSSSAGNDQATRVVDVTFQGDQMTPNGTKVDVSVGQPIELRVTADAPGEIHVHSSPEQEFGYQKGSTTLWVKPIEAPGQVTVESHTLDKVLFVLVAR